MKESLLERNLEDVSEPLNLVGAPAVSSVANLPSYHLTPWPLVNKVLDIVDTLSGGRAALVQKFFSFAFFGGIAAVVNLAVFSLLFYYIFKSVNNGNIRDTIAYVIACEVSIMANFVPNDYFTFSRTAGHQRVWSQRCLRFHITAIGGRVLTFLIQFPLLNFAPVWALPGDTAAIISVLFYNFTVPNLFTYPPL